MSSLEAAGGRVWNPYLMNGANRSKKQVVSIAILLTAVGASGLLCMLSIGVGFWAEQLANMKFVEFNLAINLLWLGTTGVLSLVLGFGVSLMFNLHKMKTQLRQSRNEYKELALLLSFGIFLIACFVVTFNLYGVF